MNVLESTDTLQGAQNPWIAKEYRNSRKLVIHFSSRGKRMGGFHRYPVRDAHEYSHLFINSDRSWYTKGVLGIGSLDESVDWLRGQVSESGASEVYTVGSSMGAFAAYLFGGALEAEAACCFAPELILGAPNSFSRADLPAIDRSVTYNRYGAPKKATLLFGAMSPNDVACARMFRDDQAVDVSIFPGMDHAISKPLSESGELELHVLRAFSETRFPVSIFGVDPKDKWRWHVWFDQIPSVGTVDFNFLLNHWAKEPLDLAPELVNRELFRTAMASMEEGDYPATNACLHILIARGHRIADCAFYIAKSARMMGRYAEAIHYYSRIALEFPGSPNARIALAHITKYALVDRAVSALPQITETPTE